MCDNGKSTPFLGRTRLREELNRNLLSKTHHLNIFGPAQWSLHEHFSPRAEKLLASKPDLTKGNNQFCPEPLLFFLPHSPSRYSWQVMHESQNRTAGIPFVRLRWVRHLSHHRMGEEAHGSLMEPWWTFGTPEILSWHQVVGNYNILNKFSTRDQNTTATVGSHDRLCWGQLIVCYYFSNLNFLEIFMREIFFPSCRWYSFGWKKCSLFGNKVSPKTTSFFFQRGSLAISWPWNISTWMKLTLFLTTLLF